MIDFTWLSFANSIAFFAAIYTAGGALCRLRHSSHHMKQRWIAIYYIMFCLAVWAMLNIALHGIDLWGCVVCVAIAAYIHLTKASWANGVPPIAQPDYVPPQSQNRRQSDLENAS
jgi:hypothetical protein